MPSTLEHQTIAKISARLLPLLIACYFAAFLHGSFFFSRHM